MIDDKKAMALECFKSLAPMQLATGHDLQMEKQKKILKQKAKDAIELAAMFNEVWDELNAPPPKTTTPPAPAGAPAK